MGYALAASLSRFSRWPSPNSPGLGHHYLRPLSLMDSELQHKNSQSRLSSLLFPVRKERSTPNLSNSHTERAIHVSDSVQTSRFWHRLPHSSQQPPASCIKLAVPSTRFSPSSLVYSTETWQPLQYAAFMPNRSPTFDRHSTACRQNLQNLAVLMLR